MTEAEHFFRNALAQMGDPVAAIKIVREKFGLTLVEAKELWARTQGHESLSAAQEVLVEPVTQVLREHNS